MTADLDSKFLHDFATRYTAAWCSGNPDAVASFFAPDGSLKINDGAPSVGRAAIADAARSFMTAFPDLRVFFDDLKQNGQRVEYHWTLSGTNSGPGGTGNKVRISGFESWQFSSDGLIQDSLGHFDAAEYARQLELGHN
jgi:predicted ester cyclase